MGTRALLALLALSLAAAPRAQELSVETTRPSPGPDATGGGDASGAPGVNLPPQQFPAVVPLTDDNFGLALGEFPTLLVKFYAEGCEGCKKIAPEFAKAGRTMKKYKIPVQFAQVNIMENDALRKSYAPEYVPLYVLFAHNEDGTESYPQPWIGPMSNATGIVHHVLHFVQHRAQPAYDGAADGGMPEEDLRAMMPGAGEMNSLQAYITMVAGAFVLLAGGLGVCFVLRRGKSGVAAANTARKGKVVRKHK